MDKFKTLREWLEEAGPPGLFKPKPWHNKEGDGIQFWWEEEECFADPKWEVSHGLVIYRAFSDRRPVGVSIWRVSLLLQNTGSVMDRREDDIPRVYYSEMLNEIHVDWGHCQRRYEPATEAHRFRITRAWTPANAELHHQVIGVHFLDARELLAPIRSTAMIDQIKASGLKETSDDDSDRKSQSNKRV